MEVSIFDRRLQVLVVSEKYFRTLSNMMYSHVIRTVSVCLDSGGVKLGGPSDLNVF